MSEQNDLIINCLIQEYAVGGCPEMGELLAAANGIGREYSALIRQFSVCCNSIIAGLDCFYYSNVRDVPYSQFGVEIGSDKIPQVYDGRLPFVLPYAIDAWIKNEPIQLHFFQFNQFFYNAEQRKKDVASLQFQIATKLKKFLKECFAQRKSEWIISLQINHALGETIISKFA